MDILNDEAKTIEDALAVIVFDAAQDGRAHDDEIKLIKKLSSELEAENKKLRDVESSYDKGYNSGVHDAQMEIIEKIHELGAVDES